MIAPATPAPPARPWAEVADEAPGWLHPADGPALYGAATLALSQTRAPSGRYLPVVEVGSYAGKSTCYLAAAADHVGARVVAVDWFRGSPEMAPGRECHHPEMLDDTGVYDTLPAFRRTLRAAGLEDTVVAVAADSETAARLITGPFAMVFIDGAHDAEGVARDLDLWGRRVAAGGRLVFHDTPVPGIAAAVETAVTEFGFTRQPAPRDMAILAATRAPRFR